jgi:AcrR family transcriptional regulator
MRRGLSIKRKIEVRRKFTVKRFECTVYWVMSEATMSEGFSDLRRRGRRPADAAQRKAKVLAALRELESTSVPFSMQDVAERVGVSRATLYRDATLRELIGAKGDGPPVRPVDFRIHEKLRTEVDALRSESRELRRKLKEAERERKALQERIASLENENSDRMYAQRAAEAMTDGVENVRQEAYAAGFQAGVTSAARGGRGAGGGGLMVAATRFPKATLAGARRTLAKAIHPDLFVDDPATQLLANEILKQLNSLTDM